jgi:hypothetical protein
MCLVQDRQLRIRTTPKIREDGAGYLSFTPPLDRHPTGTASQILLHPRDRVHNGVSVMPLPWPQISGPNEFRDHLARACLMGKRNDLAHLLILQAFALRRPAAENWQHQCQNRKSHGATPRHVRCKAPR